MTSDYYETPELPAKAEIYETNVPAAVLWVPYPDEFGWREFVVDRKDVSSKRGKPLGYK